MTDADEIRNTIARFSRALDERRSADLANCFAKDGKFGERVGRDHIREFNSKGELATNPDLGRKHAAVNIEVDVHGDTADTITDLVMLDQRGKDAPWIIAGIGKYFDKFTKTDEGWLIQERQLVWSYRLR
jgi:hypothetical protein